MNKIVSKKIKLLNRKTRKRQKYIKSELKTQIRDYKKEFTRKLKESLAEVKNIKNEDMQYTDNFVDKFNKLNNEIDKEAEIIISKGISEMENEEAKKMEEKTRKLKEKEEAKNRKLREKEEAKTRKLREKEEEKTRKLAEKKISQKTRKNRS
jgi:hypothetical protein